jgi:hypothetical protein
MSSQSRKDRAREVLGEEVNRQVTRKEQLVAASSADGLTDITPMLRVRRGGRDIVVAECVDVDRDQALWFLSLAVPGYAADAVFMTSDAHMTTAPLNPRTRRPWGPHEMQRLCDNEGACATGLITDTIFVTMFARDGSSYFGSLPYHVHKTAKKVVWVGAPEFEGTDPEDPTSFQSVGYIPDSIRAFFAQPVLSLDGLAAIGISAPEARRLADATLSTRIAQTGMYLLSMRQPS